MFITSLPTIITARVLQNALDGLEARVVAALEKPRPVTFTASARVYGSIEAEINFHRIADDFHMLAVSIYVGDLTLAAASTQFHICLDAMRNAGLVSQAMADIAGELRAALLTFAESPLYCLRQRLAMVAGNVHVGDFTRQAATAGLEEISRCSDLPTAIHLGIDRETGAPLFRLDRDHDGKYWTVEDGEPLVEIVAFLELGHAEEFRHDYHAARRAA